MKKTITSAALLASAASAFAIIAPPPFDDNSQVPNPAFQLKPQEEKFYCLNVFETAEGEKLLGSCDASRQNVVFGLETDERGCTVSQAALRVTKDIKIMACPSYVQL